MECVTSATFNARDCVPGGDVLSVGRTLREEKEDNFCDCCAEPFEYGIATEFIPDIIFIVCEACDKLLFDLTGNWCDRTGFARDFKYRWSWFI